MPNTPAALRAFVRAYERSQKAEKELDAARLALYESVKQAQAAGVPLAQMARAIGVSRQTIQKMSRR